MSESECYSRLLDGRTVLDLSSLLPGPFVATILASMGASVVKVEHPSMPDSTAFSQFCGAPLKEEEVPSPGYSFLNRQKKIIRLEYSRGGGEDRRQFEKMVREAHACILHFRSATAEKLGVDDKSLHLLNPKLVIVKITGYPEPGTATAASLGVSATTAAHDLNIQARLGLLSLTTQMIPLPVADLFAAYEGAVAVASAMDAVSRQGKSGISISVSMYGALRRAMGCFVEEFKERGETPAKRNSLFTGQFPCYRIYEAKCGQRVAVGALEPKFWSRLCKVMGLDELDGRGLETGSEGEEVVQKVSSRFREREWSEWGPLFKKADCCVEAALSFEEAFGKGGTGGGGKARLAQSSRL
uniref:CoA transferase n=1 Tax=Chromera velia CCMP2878 TaxID=1169474 RepID=A0A0G4GCH8_9ALVE|eukprot:Cvel_21308.t1-p1 / transcript=Cvel_21308.t1 / gene=Cvel_21308 / organism=Chromera_velia_CCMP2878 / gene_product=CaiB/baiF CoA-transferase family protein ZK892.4, putative / transcript_product=CaiB/baiF CoA-transferase family protein ZK892.4, putative / location=Cvel_scaffold1986:19979-21578(-) / protein_length=355 / sequence_SO=supercontig / SO=protein_coding / is_pseudo=false